MAIKWSYASRRVNNIGADEALDAGLALQVAPTVERERTGDAYGRYVGQNGVTVDDLVMVPTGEHITVTDWNKMPDGYSIVKNPYMAATPDQIADRKTWEQQGTNPNDVSLMGDDSYKTVLNAQANWKEYTALADQAEAAGNPELAAEYRAKAANEHDIAEAERAKYGYSGGADGSEHLGLMAYTGGLGYDDVGEGIDGGRRGSGGGSGFGYDPYLSKYQARIDALADAILNRDPFSYDKNNDPLYQQYKESYTRGGQRGMQDTLAQVSARTGGLASSYAETAAQQTYNNYMAELANKVPELYQLAYSMYMDDLNQDRADLSMLQGLDDTAYGRWSDALNFDYGMYRDGVADSQWQQQFDYGVSRDQVADSQWQQQFDYQKQQDAIAQQNWQTQWDYQVQQDALAREDALKKLLGGGTPSTEPAEIEEPTYTGPGGIDLTDTRGSNYQDINTQLQEMVKGGASSQDIRDAINEARDRNLLTETDYQRLVNKYR